MFIHNLLDKSCRNRFQISCFVFILSNISLIINDIAIKTIDNSFRFVSKDDNLHSEIARNISEERHSKPNTRKKKSASNIKLSQKIKKFIKNTTGERFRMNK